METFGARSSLLTDFSQCCKVQRGIHRQSRRFGRQAGRVRQDFTSGATPPPLQPKTVVDRCQVGFVTRPSQKSRLAPEGTNRVTTPSLVDAQGPPPPSVRPSPRPPAVSTWRYLWRQLRMPWALRSPPGRATPALAGRVAKACTSGNCRMCASGSKMGTSVAGASACGPTGRTWIEDSPIARLQKQDVWVIVHMWWHGGGGGGGWQFFGNVRSSFLEPLLPSPKAVSVSGARRCSANSSSSPARRGSSASRSTPASAPCTSIARRPSGRGRPTRLCSWRRRP